MLSDQTDSERTKTKGSLILALMSERAAYFIGTAFKAFSVSLSTANVK